MQHSVSLETSHVLVTPSSNVRKSAFECFNRPAILRPEKFFKAVEFLFHRAHSGRASQRTTGLSFYSTVLGLVSSIKLRLLAGFLVRHSIHNAVPSKLGPLVRSDRGPWKRIARAVLDRARNYTSMLYSIESPLCIIPILLQYYTTMLCGCAESPPGSSRHFACGSQSDGQVCHAFPCYTLATRWRTLSFARQRAQPSTRVCGFTRDGGLSQFSIECGYLQC